MKGNAVFILTNKYVRSKNEKKLDIYIDRLYTLDIYIDYITRRKILSSSRDSDFASQNKEENPLLAKGLAFSFGKQGGFYVKQIIDSG